MISLTKKQSFKNSGGNGKKRPRFHESKQNYTGDHQLVEECELDEDATEFILNKIAIGAEYPFTLDLKAVLEDASETNLNFVSVPLFHPRLRRDANGVSDMRKGSRTRSEFAIDYNEWSSFVIGTMSPWIQLDNRDHRLRIGAEKALEEEYAYANHLGLQSVFMPPVSVSNLTNSNYARVLRQMCSRFPLTSPHMIIKVPWQVSNTSTLGEPIDGWEIWDTIRHRVDHHPKVKVAIEFPDDFSLIKLNGDLFRWAGEPLKAIILPTSLFTLSKSRKKIILSKSARKVIHWLFQFNVHIVLKGNPLPDFGMNDYVDCLEKLNFNGVDGQGPSHPTLYEKFTSNYKDSLRGPLDPLHDNLDSDTYRIMEQDPIKYERYEEALEAAMRDIYEQRHGKISRSKEHKLHVLVVGPGRGPLIQSSLQAAGRLKIEVDVTAVEKNVNAVITLRNRFSRNRNVSIIQSDMRKVLNIKNSPIKLNSVDIIVSELLGSFGDNEASPECLDYIQGALRDDGVMIPERYCSFIAPLSSSVMWMSARDMFHQSDPRNGLDCPYVVCFHAVHVLSIAKPVFEVRSISFFRFNLCNV